MGNALDELPFKIQFTQVFSGLINGSFSLISAPGRIAIRLSRAAHPGQGKILFFPPKHIETCKHSNGSDFYFSALMTRIMSTSIGYGFTLPVFDAGVILFGANRLNVMNRRYISLLWLISGSISIPFASALPRSEMTGSR